MTRVPAGSDRPPQGPRAGRWWWSAIASYFAASCLLHLQFSLWLVRPRELPWGLQKFSDLVPVAAAIGAGLLAVFVVRQLQRSPRSWLIGGSWLLWALAVVAIDRLLTYSASEYFHYPQYALLAWLIARALDPEHRRWIPGRVLFWTTLLGAVDELLQYLWITASYSHYFDFNDVIVNFVAAVAGVLIYYGAPAGRSAQLDCPGPPVREASAAVLLALVVGAGLASGQIQLTSPGTIEPGGLTWDAHGRPTLHLQRGPDQHGRWQRGPHRGLHYVLRPVEGLLALAAAAALLGLGLRAGARQVRGGDDEAATISASSAAKSR